MTQMNIGSVFGKRHLFQKREAIDAERLCQLYYDFQEEKSRLENAKIRAKVFIPNLNRDIYMINTADFIPPRCKIGKPFEIIYDKETRKLYAISQECGVFRFMMNDTLVEFNSSDMIPAKKETIAGRTLLEYAEYFRDNNFNKI